MTITTLGVIIGLVVAIVLIIYKVPPVYGMMIGAIIGGLAGGASMTETISCMISGAGGISSAIMRIIAAGMLVGFLIASGSAETIANTIINKMGEKYALFAVVLAAWVLMAVGTFGDVTCVIMAPIALDIARRTGASKVAAFVCLRGGIHTGNVVSPNANTIALAENLGVPLTNVMMGGLIPSAFGVLACYVLMKALRHKGTMVTEADVITEETGESRALPSFGRAIAGPLCTIVLLGLRTAVGITIDPIIALPVGGIVGSIVTGQFKKMLDYAVLGINRMSSIVLLLLGTGTISGIIASSSLKETLVHLVTVSGMPGFLLAPISGLVMGAATASVVAGVTTASQIFGETIMSFGVSALQAAVMIHTGACILDGLPHGSFFHISAGSLRMSIKERLSVIPYEAMIGLTMTVASTIVYGVLQIL